MSDLSKKTLIPSDDTKNYIENYWTKRADAFAALRRQELHSEKYSQWQREIVQHLPPAKQLRILDVGCGAGFFSVLLANEGHRVTGIDLTPAMIAQAETLAAAEGCSCTFQTADAEHTAFSDGSFDVVIARNLMWNLPHPETAYAEWLRVLAPKGILLNYDAEYAKDHHRQKLPALNAHADVSAELLNECHNIYHMLEISLFERPRWDLEILKALGSCSCSVDQSVGDRIYAEQDIFYIPVPMFCIKSKNAWLKTRRFYYSAYSSFSMRSIASIVFSRLPKADRRKYPSPIAPKPAPGVPTTASFSSRKSKNSQEDIPCGHCSQI